MSVLTAAIVPHPPVIVPEVGMGQEKAIQGTIDSYHEVSKTISDLKPETIILISPHAPAYADYIHMASGQKISGSLKAFGGNQVMECLLDESLINEVCRLCDEQGFPAGTLGEGAQMDHGAFVPLYFLNQYYTGYQLVLCSLSGLARQEHYAFGKILKTAAENMGRSTVVIASGDLSHKLKEKGPYQFAKEGPELDLALTNIMRGGCLTEFLKVDSKLCKMGAECGLGAFITMAGTLDQTEVIPDFLSYEDTFGVGYAVSLFVPAKVSDRVRIQRTQEDCYVKLARETLECYVKTGRMPNMPEDLPEELIGQQAGTFVSIKKDGALRGCIGTIQATQENIALEIMYNAISSGTRDPRFHAVQEEELPELIYNVDVLSEEKPVEDKGQLDPKRFGVIVSKGRKRGLLLPNLEGVDTVEEQISIACQKAGIHPGESYVLSCFEVVRHT